MLLYTCSKDTYGCRTNYEADRVTYDGDSTDYGMIIMNYEEYRMYYAVVSTNYYMDSMK